MDKEDVLSRVARQHVDAPVQLFRGVVEVRTHAHMARPVVYDDPVACEVLHRSGRVVVLDHEDEGSVGRFGKRE